MASPGVILSDKSRRDPRVAEARVVLADAWPVFAWLGATFLAMGLIDLALAWFPLGFGNAEWEFGTISATLNGLPLPTLGLVLLLVSGAALERRWQTRAVAVATLTIALLLTAAAFLYATVLPIALNVAGADNPLVRAGLQKAGIKAGALFILYVTLYIGVGIKAFRLSAPR